MIDNKKERQIDKSAVLLCVGLLFKELFKDGFFFGFVFF